MCSISKDIHIKHEEVERDPLKAFVLKIRCKMNSHANLSCLLICASQVRIFETHCGSLSQYGMKHMRSIANICNAGVNRDQMIEVCAQACTSFPSNPWSSLHRGFSAWYLGMKHTCNYLSLYLELLVFNTFFHYYDSQ